MRDGCTRARVRRTRPAVRVTSVGGDHRDADGDSHHGVAQSVRGQQQDL